MGSVSTKAQVEAVGYTFRALKFSVQGLPNPVGGSLSAAVKKARQSPNPSFTVSSASSSRIIPSVKGK